MSEINKRNGAVIVSWVFTPGAMGILLVGQQTAGKVEVINQFTGEEAEELFHKLTTRKEEKNNE